MSESVPDVTPVNPRSPRDGKQPQPGRILFFDTTLRDGEQSPGCVMYGPEKLRMAHQIAALGVAILEAGFAIASEGDAESIRNIAREVGSARGPIIASLARARRDVVPHHRDAGVDADPDLETSAGRR